MRGQILQVHRWVRPCREALVLGRVGEQSGRLSDIRVRRLGATLFNQRLDVGDPELNTTVACAVVARRRLRATRSTAASRWRLTAEQDDG